MRRKLLTIALGILGIPAFAIEPYEATVQTILDNSPDLQGQLSLIAAQRYDASDANALADPEVAFARVWGRHAIGNKLQLDVSQSFEWPGVYSARSHAAESEQMSALAEYQAARYEKAKEVKALLNELVYIRHQKEVVDDLMCNFRDLSDAIDKGVSGGELTVLDQRKMEIERFEIENDMATATAREQEIIANLQGMSTKRLDLSSITSYPIQTLLSRQDYLDNAACDPNVMAQNAVADAETQIAKAAKMQRMPGFSVGYQHQAEMGDRFNGFTVSMTLPVFQNRHGSRAAMQRKEAAEYGRETALAKRRAEIMSTYSTLETQKSRLDAYNRTFGDRTYLKLLLKAYKGGQINVIDYLSEVHYYHQNMLLYLDMEYNYQQALTLLNSGQTTE